MRGLLSHLPEAILATFRNARSLRIQHRDYGPAGINAVDELSVPYYRHAGNKYVHDACGRAAKFLFVQGSGKGRQGDVEVPVRRPWGGTDFPREIASAS